jgi:hypothetical protein
MAKIRVLAGDIQEGEWGMLATPKLTAMAYAPLFSRAKPQRIVLDQELSSVEQVTTESVKKLGASAAWAAVGALAFGPLGLLGGALLGGRKNTVCFAAILKDGRRFFAECEAGAYKDVVAASFRASKVI